MNELEQKVYATLSTRTRRALRRTKKRFSRTAYYYWPRADLVQRLTRQFGLTDDEVYEALYRIRQELLR